MPRFAVLLTFAFVACGPSPDDDAGGGTGGGGDDLPGDAPDDTPGDADDTDGAATPTPPGGLQHGSVKLEFRRGNGVDGDPFAGTAVVQVVLNYEACLVNFYKANPNWGAMGPDGSTVFGPASAGGEGWRDRLCNDLGTVDCEVLEFQQQIDDAQGNFLSVRYAVSESVENKELHFGPLPLAPLAACPDSTLPTVRVASNGAARGLDSDAADATVLWTIQSFNPGTAVADQGASIGIDVEPVQ